MNPQKAEQLRLKKIFYKAANENKPFGSLPMNDGIFYGRVIESTKKTITLIGMKKGKYHIYTGEPI